MQKELFDQFYERFKPKQMYDEFQETIRIVEEHKPKGIVEIGIHKGGTLAFWYHLIPEDGFVIGIDPFIEQKVIEMFPSDYKELIFIPRKSKGAIENVKRRANGRPIDFIFIDGDHVLMDDDLRWYWPLLREGGLIAIHDFKGSMGRPTYDDIEKGGWDRYYNFGESGTRWGTAYVWKSKTGRKELRGSPPLWIKK
jgi:predicted O-methyltransferase YrrM